MKTFAEVDVYNRTTGAKEVDFRDVGLVCDFCGKVIETEGYGYGVHQQVSFNVIDVGGAEESYYYYSENMTDEVDIPEGVDWLKIFTEHPNFDYCCDEVGVSCSRKFLSLPKKLTHDSSGYKNLETVMQEQRLRVVSKLLTEGRSPKELGIEED